MVYHKPRHVSENPPPCPSEPVVTNYAYLSFEKCDTKNRYCDLARYPLATIFLLQHPIPNECPAAWPLRYSGDELCSQC
jgi:hypothetical protein